MIIPNNTSINDEFESLITTDGDKLPISMGNLITVLGLNVNAPNLLSSIMQCQLRYLDLFKLVAYFSGMKT